MPSEVKIADFKSHLSEHLRRVRLGHEVVIKDRETPIARVVPYQTKGEELLVRPPTRPLKDLRRLPGVKAKKLKPGDLDRALRATKSDSLDSWLSAKRT
jgi:prevent-host-death family protein